MCLYTCVCVCGNVSICNEKLQLAREVVDNLLRTKTREKIRLIISKTEFNILMGEQGEEEMHT